MAILSKGMKLSYSTTSSGSYTEIDNVVSWPDMGSAPDQVECTTLSNEAHVYLKGLKNNSDMSFELLYDNSDATSNFRVLKGLEDSGASIYWRVEFPDALTTGTGTHHGTQFAFSGQPSVVVAGGTYNEALKFNLNITVNSDITVTDPA